MKKLAGIAAMSLTCASISAQVSLSPEGAGPVPPGRCADGIVHDDGTVEAAYGFARIVPRFGLVEPFDATQLNGRLDTLWINSQQIEARVTAPGFRSSPW